MSRRLSRRLSRRTACYFARQLRPEAKSTLVGSTLGHLLLAATVVAAASFVDQRLFGDRAGAEPDAPPPLMLAAVNDATLGGSAPGETTLSDAAVGPSPVQTAETRRRSSLPAFNPQRFLLNALLAPALDPDTDPPTWTDPRPAIACDPTSTVRIDGRPLVAGATVPSGQFSMDWQAHGCRPFGLHGPRFDGSARLIVNPVGDAWTAVVLPDGMAITLADGRAMPLAASRARMPLGSSPAARLPARDDRRRLAGDDGQVARP